MKIRCNDATTYSCTRYKEHVDTRRDREVMLLKKSCLKTSRWGPERMTRDTSLATVHMC